MKINSALLVIYDLCHDEGERPRLDDRAELQVLPWTRPVGIVTIVVTVMGKHGTETVPVFARWDAKRDGQLIFPSSSSICVHW